MKQNNQTSIEESDPFLAEYRKINNELEKIEEQKKKVIKPYLQRIREIQEKFHYYIEEYGLHDNWEIELITDKDFRLSLEYNNDVIERELKLNLDDKEIAKFYYNNDNLYTFYRLAKDHQFVAKVFLDKLFDGSIEKELLEITKESIRILIQDSDFEENIDTEKKELEILKNFYNDELED